MSASKRLPGSKPAASENTRPLPTEYLQISGGRNEPPGAQAVPDPAGHANQACTDIWLKHAVDTD